MVLVWAAAAALVVLTSSFISENGKNRKASSRGIILVSDLVQRLSDGSTIKWNISTNKLNSKVKAKSLQQKYYYFKGWCRNRGICLQTLRSWWPSYYHLEVEHWFWQFPDCFSIHKSKFRSQTSWPPQSWAASSACRSSPAPPSPGTCPQYWHLYLSLQATLSPNSLLILERLQPGRLNQCIKSDKILDQPYLALQHSLAPSHSAHKILFRVDTRVN